MAWIELHQSLLNHRKTQQAAEALKIDPVTMVGHLAFLWCWCLDNAPDGDLTDISPRILSNAAQWRRDPDLFVSTLTDAGFIDRDELGRSLHDWLQYAGKLIDQRKRNAERQAAFRERNRYVTVTSSLRNGATVPNRTQPNHTVTPKSSSSTTNVGRADEPSPQAPAAAASETPKSQEVETETPARVWEDSVGRPITERECQALGDLETSLENARAPAIWLTDAIKEAAAHGKEKVKLRYVERILERWHEEGRDNGLRAGTKRQTGGVEGGTPRVEINYQQAIDDAYRV